MSDGLNTTPRSDPSAGKATECQLTPSHRRADGLPLRRKPRTHTSAADGAEMNRGVKPVACGMVAVVQCRPFQCTEKGPVRRSPIAQIFRLLSAAIARSMGWAVRLA